MKAADDNRMHSNTFGFVHLGSAVVATVLAVWAADVSIALKVPAFIGGVAIGVWAGGVTARRLERRVDGGGGIVLYAEDTAPHALLWPLGVLALSPFAFSAMPGEVVSSRFLQQVLQLMLCGPTATWLAHDVLVARALRAMSASRGALRVQWFHGRSVAGPEAMIGKTGQMTSAGPIGYVRIAGELWRAESIDGSVLSAGQLVTARRLIGLVLLVEADDSKASNMSVLSTAGEPSDGRPRASGER